MVLLVASLGLSACEDKSSVHQTAANKELITDEDTETIDYLTVVDDEPDTMDFQCTSIYYTVALTVFNRLVEMETGPDGEVQIVPALAKSWEVSEDGLNYVFHLRDGVMFSNGSPLTTSDVRYTFERLLTNPDSCNSDIVQEIKGADALKNGETDSLEGFIPIDNLTFAVILEEPFEAFLACLSMPGASILDESSTKKAGSSFGRDPETMIGTGSYILTEWDRGKGMKLVANPNCWEGRTGSAGIEILFATDSEEQRMMFEDGELDILDLDNLDSSAEFFIHGDIYQDRLHETQQIAITYIALNESVKPLDDVRVRKALQLSLDRQMLLDAVYSGRGHVENGIFPRGLNGFNPDLPEIPYDPSEAKQLITQAGFPNGFDLTIALKSTSNLWEKQLVQMAAEMWERIGIRVKVELMDENRFMSLRKSGELPCYCATWSADYDDPDNFIYTFFGSRQNTIYRSLCYLKDNIIKRVRRARGITDPQARIQEYQDLEELIIQEDAAWIPLFSRYHYYVAGNQVENLEFAWNGWVSPRYRYIKLKEQ